MKKYRFTATVETTMVVEVENDSFGIALEEAYKIKKDCWNKTGTSRFEIVSGRMLSDDEAKIPF